MPGERRFTALSLNKEGIEMIDAIFTKLIEEAELESEKRLCCKRPKRYCYLIKLEGKKKLPFWKVMLDRKTAGSLERRIFTPLQNLRMKYIFSRPPAGFSDIEISFAFCGK